jgi:hypothetical protein
MEKLFVYTIVRNKSSYPITFGIFVIVMLMYSLQPVNKILLRSCQLMITHIS